LTKSKRSHWKL